MWQVCHVQDLRDIIKRFLVQNPNQRLGALKGGAADVKMHPWFANFDWAGFAKRQLKAPYVPQVLPCSCAQYFRVSVLRFKTITNVIATPSCRI